MVFISNYVARISFDGRLTADDASPSGFVSSRRRRRFVQKADVTMWVQCMLIIS